MSVSIGGGCWWTRLRGWRAARREDTGHPGVCARNLPLPPEYALAALPLLEEGQERCDYPVGCREAVGRINVLNDHQAVLEEELVTLDIDNRAVLAVERRAVHLQDAPRPLPAHQKVCLPILPGARRTEPRERIRKEEHARPVKRLGQA